MITEAVFTPEVIAATQRQFGPRPVLGSRSPGGPATIIGWFAVHLLGKLHEGTPFVVFQK